jgi:rhodanese-related sulfurtransferase
MRCWWACSQSASWVRPASVRVTTATRRSPGSGARALHLSLPDLPTRVGDVSPGVVWVHCGSGYRATAAASLLARAGRTVVVIDDNYGNADTAGIALTTPA